MADPTTERTADMRAASDVLGVVSTLLDTIDWDELADNISRAEALGPIVMPTEFAASLESGRLANNARAVAATCTYLAALRDVAPDVRADG